MKSRPNVSTTVGFKEGPRRVRSSFSRRSKCKNAPPLPCYNARKLGAHFSQGGKLALFFDQTRSRVFVVFCPDLHPSSEKTRSKTRKKRTGKKHRKKRSQYDRSKNNVPKKDDEKWGKNLRSEKCGRLRRIGLTARPAGSR